METANKIIPTKIVLSLDGSESFIISRLKDKIIENPMRFECEYSDLKGKKYRIFEDNELNPTDVLKSVEFIYYKDNKNSPDYFKLSNFYTNNIKITEPVNITHKLILFRNNKNVMMYKIVEFFITLNDIYRVKIIGTICIGRCLIPNNISDTFNKINSIALVDRYAFIDHKFKINDDNISMKIDYIPGYDIREGYFMLKELLEDALEKYYASLRKLAKGE